MIFRINSNSKLRPNQFWDSFRTTNCVVNHETEHVKQISKQTTIFRADNSDCHFILFCNLKLYCNWDWEQFWLPLRWSMEQNHYMELKYLPVTQSISSVYILFLLPSFNLPTKLRCTMYSVFISVTQFRLAASVPSAVPAFKWQSHNRH